MIIVFLVYAFMLVLVLPGIVKRKEWRELAAFSVLYVIAFVLSVLYALDIPIPSPMKGLDYLISDILGLKYPK